MTAHWSGEPIPEDTWSAVVEIYREAFPAAERVAEDALRASIEQGRRSLWTAGSVEAFAVAQDLRTAPPWVFGEYLAVRADLRSSGHGGRLLAALRQSGRPLVLEVEDPATAGPTAERRIRFYERFGARRVPGSHGFRAPDLAAPGQTVPMWLLDFGDPQDTDPRLGVTLARAIWIEGYGLEEDSPALRRLASALPADRSPRAQP